MVKRCPECNRTYSDDTLSFCLADGTLLSAPYENQAARPFSDKANQAPTEMMPEILKQAESTPSPPPTIPISLPPPSRAEFERRPSLKKRSIKPWLVLGVIAAVLIIGVMIAVRYNTRSSGEKEAAESQPVSDEALLAELVSLHQQYYDAYNRGDSATVARVLADDFNGGLDEAGKPIDQDKDGNPINKSQSLAKVKPDPNIASNLISQPRLVSRTADSAVVRFTNTVNFKTGTPLTITDEIIGRYVKRAGRWQIVSSTISP